MFKHLNHLLYLVIYNLKKKKKWLSYIWEIKSTSVNKNNLGVQGTGFDKTGENSQLSLYKNQLILTPNIFIVSKDDLLVSSVWVAGSTHTGQQPPTGGQHSTPYGRGEESYQLFTRALEFYKSAGSRPDLLLTNTHVEKKKEKKHHCDWCCYGKWSHWNC